MKIAQQKFIMRLTAVLLVLAITLPMPGQWMVTVGSAAVTQSEIDKMKKEAQALAARQKELEAQIQAVTSDKNAALRQKSLLEEQIVVLVDEIGNISEQITKYSELVVLKQADLAQAEQDEQEQYALFCERVRLMEEEGEVSYWSILFNASDFSDLLDRFTMVDEIMEYDNAVMNELVVMREKIIADKLSLEASLAEQEAAKQQQLAAQQTLQGRKAEVEKTIKTILGQEDSLEQAEKDLKAAGDEIDAEIRRKEIELENQLADKGGIVSESGFIWPLSTKYMTLISLFGGRIHPITGKADHHLGIDIPAPSGTHIYAGKSGVVLTAEYHWSYGNYIVVSHGNGQTSLYAHMKSKAIVPVGATVKQGQVIGYVGTTGSSTGNHLHYEIRTNSVRKDPVNYYPDFDIYVRGSSTPL